MQENNIVVIKKQTHDSIDFNNEYTLPDYIVDVKKLVSCGTKAAIHNVYRTGNTLTFEGEVSYSILVICEDDCIKNLIYSEDFTVNGESCDCESSVHDCRLESSAARLVSPRKLNCRAKLIITSTNNLAESTETVFCGAGLPESEYITEKKTETNRFLTFYDEELQKQHASRDIELTAAKDEVSNIVYCKVNIRITERKISEGKLLLRGESVCEILYETINGEYAKHLDRIPFSDMVENRNEATAHLCEVSVGDIKVSVRNNSFGEMKIIELDYTYSLRCRSYVEKEVEILRDVYSTEYDVECSFNSATALTLNSVFSSSLSVNDAYSVDELGDMNNFDIIDHNVSVSGVNVKSDALNGRLIVNGELKFDIIYKADEYGYHTLTTPFKYERELDCGTADIYCEHSVCAQSVSCTVDKGRLHLNAEVYFNIMIAEPVSYEYIEKAEFLPCAYGNNSPVIIYYPDKGETLWDIAKKYKTTCKDIIRVNSLNSEDLNDIKVLLLPKKKLRSIYNTII